MTIHCKNPNTNIKPRAAIAICNSDVPTFLHAHCYFVFNVQLNDNPTRLFIHTISFHILAPELVFLSLQFQLPTMDHIHTSVLLFQTFRHRVVHPSGPPCFLKLGCSMPPLDYTQSLGQTGVVAGGCAGTSFHTHQTKGSDLGGQGRSGSHLSSCAPHVHCRMGRKGRVLEAFCDAGLSL